MTRVVCYLSTAQSRRGDEAIEADRTVVANLSSGQTAEEKIPASLNAQIICAFQEWTIGAEAELGERWKRGETFSGRRK